MYTKKSEVFGGMGEDGEYRLGYRSDIEGLRAVAILLVVAVHAGVPWLNGGFVGVDIFFVLSGFLITGLLVQEISRTGSLQFSNFYMRRIRRLFPALFFMLVGSSGLAWLLLPLSAQIPQTMAGLSAAAWFSNIHFAYQKLDYFAAGTETNIFLHTWSLGVEEQFYLIWPLLVYVLLRHKDPARGLVRLAVGMVVVAVTSFSACVWATQHAPQFAFYMMPMRAWQFALGALVWLSSWKGLDRFGGIMQNGRASGAAGWLGIAMLCAAAFGLDANHPYPGFYALLPTLGASFLIASGSFGTVTAVQKCLSWPPLQAIGRISYSWYLWHWPALLLGYAITGSNTAIYRLVYVAISLLIAVISYRFVESPIRHQRWWLVHKRAAAYVTTLLVAFFILGSLQWYTQTIDRMGNAESRRIVKARGDLPAIYSMDCDESFASDDVKPCTFGDVNANHTVVLVGDSIAGQWFPAVAKLYKKTDWRLIVLTKSACPMVDRSFFYARIRRTYSECVTWRRGVLEDIAKIKPDVVFMSSADTYVFTPEEWDAGSAPVMQAISKSASRVYVLRATPHLLMDGPDCLAENAERPRWLPRTRSCNFPSHSPEADTTYSFLQRAARPFSNIEFVDMNDQICPDETCRAELNGVVVFRDSVHMTASFAESLAPVLGRRLQLDAPSGATPPASDFK
jgi:peptidoglycan/LPS O-acetylase OafA/YrhL